jgi:mRNA-degrading endonuclease RelE of RelBE toxin-antitoxin system
MFQIAFTPAALEALEDFRKYDRRRILDEIETQLSHKPNQETRRRKRLRPNQSAEWELRIGEFRVFYDVVPGTELVKIVIVGVKRGNKLFVEGQEFEL